VVVFCRERKALQTRRRSTQEGEGENRKKGGPRSVLRIRAHHVPTTSPAIPTGAIGPPVPGVLHREQDAYDCDEEGEAGDEEDVDSVHGRVWRGTRRGRGCYEYFLPTRERQKPKFAKFDNRQTQAQSGKVSGPRRRYPNHQRATRDFHGKMVPTRDNPNSNCLIQ
jgi:hypothetical protein